MNKQTPLQIAQVAFADWLGILDGLLETAQLKNDEALGAARNGDQKAFGTALGVSMKHVDDARAEIRAGLRRGA